MNRTSVHTRPALHYTQYTAMPPIPKYTSLWTQSAPMLAGSHFMKNAAGLAFRQGFNHWDQSWLSALAPASKLTLQISAVLRAGFNQLEVKLAMQPSESVTPLVTWCWVLYQPNLMEFKQLRCTTSLLMQKKHYQSKTFDSAPFVRNQCRINRQENWRSMPIGPMKSTNIVGNPILAVRAAQNFDRNALPSKDANCASTVDKIPKFVHSRLCLKILSTQETLVMAIQLSGPSTLEPPSTILSIKTHSHCHSVSNHSPICTASEQPLPVVGTATFHSNPAVPASPFKTFFIHLH